MTFKEFVVIYVCLWFQALEEYSSLIDSSSSFRAYRAALAEVEPPCIPYL